MFLGALILREPRLAPWLGMGESVVSFFLVVSSILLPIWALPQILGAGAGTEGVGLLGPTKLVNALLSGAVFVWSFQVNRASAFAGLRGA